MTIFAIAIAAGDIIKYQSFVYGSFVWEIHVRYNNKKYTLYSEPNVSYILFDICGFFGETGFELSSFYSIAATSKK